MVYILQDPATHQWGFRVVEEVDGAQRVITEEFGYDGPGSLISVTNEYKEALSRNNVRTEKGGTLGSWVVRIIGNKGQDIFVEDGHQTAEEAQRQISSLKNSFIQGIKTIFPSNIKTVASNTRTLNEQNSRHQRELSEAEQSAIQRAGMAGDDQDDDGFIVK